MIKRGYMYHYLMLAMLGAYVFDTVREGVDLASKADAKRAYLRNRQLLNERLLAITKSTWPKCVEMKMTAEACKDFIDKEIYDHFTERDQYIRSVIMGKRRKTDKSYNAVTILMNDNDMVLGRDGDGWVYYDFTWDGTGEPATAEQQSALPPISAMEPSASLSPIGIEPETLPATVPPADPYAPTPTDTTPTDPVDPDPTDDDIPPEEPPLIVFDEVIEGVSGATVDEYLAAATAPDGGGDTAATAPIAGGVITDGTAENTPGGDALLQEAIDALPPGGETGVVEGERSIEPIYCGGLTGESCCLLVKLKVRDHDIHDNAIQCTLNYVESTEKKKYWKNLRGKKVHIFSNHNGIVSKIPQIVGDWPKGITGAEFEAWLLEAGSPPLILQ